MDKIFICHTKRIHAYPNGKRFYEEVEEYSRQKYENYRRMTLIPHVVKTIKFENVSKICKYTIILEKRRNIIKDMNIFGGMKLRTELYRYI